jgi:hypothetical protein
VKTGGWERWAIATLQLAVLGLRPSSRTAAPEPALEVCGPGPEPYSENRLRQPARKCARLSPVGKLLSLHFLLLRGGPASPLGPSPASPPPTAPATLRPRCGARPGSPQRQTRRQAAESQGGEGLPGCCPRPARPALHVPGGRWKAQPCATPRCPSLPGQRASGRQVWTRAGGGRRAAGTVRPGRSGRLRARRPARTSAMASRVRPRSLLLLLPGLLLPICGAFNLDVNSPAEYSGPEGSYFGFAVDFFVPSASS